MSKTIHLRYFHHERKHAYVIKNGFDIISEQHKDNSIERIQQRPWQQGRHIPG